MKQLVILQKQRTWLWATLVAVLIGGLCVSWAASSPLLIGIGGWSPVTALPQALASRNAVVHNGYIYLVGGKNASDSPVSNIYSGLVKSDGNVDAWSVAGQLAVPVYLHAIAASDTHLFVIGGWDGTQTRTEVWRAAFAAGGGLGAFQKVNDYPVTIDLHDAVVVQNRIYVVGGWTGREALNTVYYAEIQPSGLGSWVATTPLPRKLYRLSVATYNNVIYVTGGYDGAARANVYSANVRSDGSLEAWQETAALPNPVYYQEAVIHDGRLLVVGGKNDSAEFNQIYSANITAGGSLTGWNAEPALPESLYRFAAVTLQRSGSDFIMVLGGLHGVDYRSNVYHSAVPNPPTPTNTPTQAPTPTATPIPVQGGAIYLTNEPAHWVGPNEEIKYTITYVNPSTRRVTNVTIRDVIPEGVELIADSVQTSPGGSVEVQGTQPGSEIVWTVGDLAAGTSGQVAYRVRRTAPPTPAVPRPLAISVSGPSSAEPDQPIEYTISLTNSTFLTFTNLVVVNTLPVGARYISGADNGPVDNKVSWTIPVLLGEEAVQRTFVVEADHSLVNYSYFVSSDEGPTAKGRTVVVTSIDNTAPPAPGDGVWISKTGATASWDFNNQRQSITSNGVYNPSAKDFLPLIRR